jgi:hypothetical protein
VFTRFVPPDKPEDAKGAWRWYYERWRDMTGDRIDPRLIRLVPPLAAVAIPDLVIDKAHYSPFKEAIFLRTLRQLEADALVISGGENRCLRSGGRHGRRRRRLQGHSRRRRAVQRLGRIA